MKTLFKKSNYQNLDTIELINMKFKLKFFKSKKKKFIFILLIIFILFYISYFIIKLIFIIFLPYKNLKICLCVIAKRENLYAKEFVNHYKKLGYNHIYLYDNNDENDEKYEDVLQDDINSNFVTIVNIRGKIKGQCYAYIDCYEKHNKEYDWLSFFDMDEFLEVKAKNIQEFVTNPRYDKCVVIKVNQLFYSDNELLYYDNRTLEERFTTPLYKSYSNIWSKVTVMGGIKENYWSIGCTPHTSKFNVTNCDSTGNIVGFGQLSTKPNFTYAALKHYYTKTAEEYFIKSSRGSAFNKVTWDKNRKLFKYKLFFSYNKKTKEKDALIKKLFNMTL
jgi:hypothetical protein